MLELSGIGPCSVEWSSARCLPVREVLVRLTFLLPRSLLCFSSSSLCRVISFWCWESSVKANPSTHPSTNTAPCLQTKGTQVNNGIVEGVTSRTSESETCPVSAGFGHSPAGTALSLPHTAREERVPVTAILFLSSFSSSPFQSVVVCSLQRTRGGRMD